MLDVSGCNIEHSHSSVLRVTTHYILLNIAACDFLNGLLAQPIMLLNVSFIKQEFCLEVKKTDSLLKEV